MKFVDEFQNSELGRNMARRIRQTAKRPLRLMEFCGTHTVSILRHGIRQVLPPNLEMLSGPGCPVCVTANADLDRAIALAGQPDVIMTTFGDMMKVPGSRSSLQQARAEGADIRVVYASQDALSIARDNPAKKVVFLGIGFETTAPTIAATVLEAERQQLGNFYLFSRLKVCPPVMKALLDLGEVKLDGIICPGHVSVVIGSHPYEFIPRDYDIGCVISGFEPLDILQTVAMLVAQVQEGRPRVEIAYRRGVKPEGNSLALRVLYQVFETGAANWRGIGEVPGSGLRLRGEFARFDAEKVLPVTIPPPHEPKGCRCGEILRGVRTPGDCPLFGKACTPEQPQGPCMVSSEGTCAAHYRYGGAIPG
ncbi:MAG: hydrogenase formation protein HypD [Chloroflexota bacterium]